MENPDKTASAFDEISISLLSQGKSVRMRGSGNSMAPFIKNGSLIVIDPIRSTPKWGDVLLFRTALNRLLIHRVIAVKHRKGAKLIFLMRGDANSVIDGWITEDNILGIVNSTEGLGRPSFRLFCRNFILGLIYSLKGSEKID